MKTIDINRVGSVNWQRARCVQHKSNVFVALIAPHNVPYWVCHTHQAQGSSIKLWNDVDHAVEWIKHLRLSYDIVQVDNDAVYLAWLTAMLDHP